MTPEQMLDELCGMANAATPADALEAVRSAVARNAQIAQPLVYLDPAGKMNVAPLTVRQIMQIIAALEGLQVK
jgi:hypothetical protein